MKITREMLTAWRGMVTVDGDNWGDIRRADLHALLDERKALRAALDQACGEITNWRHKEAVAALALGEDEE